MNLEILTPEKKLFSADVYGVQLPGVMGLFEVLNHHAPLVSALKEGKIKVLKDKKIGGSYILTLTEFLFSLRQSSCPGHLRTLFLPTLTMTSSNQRRSLPRPQHHQQRH